MAKKSPWWWLLGVGACAGASAACFAPTRPPPGPQPVAAAKRVRVRPPSSPAHGPEVELLARFDGFLKEQGDLEVSELWSRLRVASPHDQALPFEPRAVPYFDTIARELELTQRERELFGRQGFVRSGMAGAYRAGHPAGSAGVHA